MHTAIPTKTFWSQEPSTTRFSGADAVIPRDFVQEQPYFSLQAVFTGLQPCSQRRVCESPAAEMCRRRTLASRNGIYLASGVAISLEPYGIGFLWRLQFSADRILAVQMLQCMHSAVPVLNVTTIHNLVDFSPQYAASSPFTLINASWSSETSAATGAASESLVVDSQ
jgi:hypothetical protein